MEALIGTLLASQDPRARTLVQDIIQDPFAREVLSRVDRSIVASAAKGGSKAPAVGRTAMTQVNPVEWARG